uniref:Uncharacterized protein n=1 Tax=Ditylenchus dipsaci TaxID=166011 RepID=A0A915EKZ1_9BILA
MGYMAPVVSWIIYTVLYKCLPYLFYMLCLFRLASVYGKADIFRNKSIVMLLVLVELLFVTPLIIVSLCWYPPEGDSREYMQKLI